MTECESLIVTKGYTNELLMEYINNILIISLTFAGCINMFWLYQIRN